jgi:hypothetical protein
MYDLQVSVSMVANDILTEAGESLSVTSGTGTLSAALGSWVRRAGTAADQLSALCDAVGAVWRVELDGSIFVGTDAYPVITGWDHDVPQDGWNPGYGSLRVQTTELGAAPGQSYLGTIPGLDSPRRIGGVCYTTGDGPQGWLYFVDERAPESDNQAHALREFVRETMRGVEWFPSVSGRVAVQRADGTLDVYPDDKRLPSLTSVRLRLPVPGAKLVVVPGSQVTVLFENGDPRQRVAVAYAGGNATAPVALVGDNTNTGTLTIATALAGTPPSGTIVVSYVDGAGLPGPQPSPLTITVASGLIIDVTPPGVVLFSLLGKITGPGSQYLKIP